MKYIKLFENFINEEKSKTPFEITSVKGLDVKEATKLIRDNYHDNLTYKGHEFFDKIYMNILGEFSYKELGIGEYVDVNHIDDETGEEFTEKERVDGQESYLGYLPDEDIFIEGYDMFDFDGSNLVFIKLDDNLKPTNVSNKFPHLMAYSTMMYGSRGVYDTLHKKYPTLIDIRLD